MRSIRWWEFLQGTVLAFAGLILPISLIGSKEATIAGSKESVGAVLKTENRPLRRYDWAVSTPDRQALDPELIGRLYERASELETLYSLLVVKDGFLVAEQYFNDGTVDAKTLVQSVSKSCLSALIGIAENEGYLSVYDQKMVDFFPEISDRLTDPRKNEITIQQMLQMRSGYPDEETDTAYLDALYQGISPPLIEDLPLVDDPGISFNYSNLTYNWLAIILERTCGQDLKSFAQQHLFDPIGVEVGDWLQDWEGHYIGSGGIHLSARDAARFGQLYLKNGESDGVPVVPASWVRDSLEVYSDRTRNYGWRFAFKNLGYGYGWWTADVGNHVIRFAWGHGGQLIVLLEELDMVIVTTADPFYGQHDSNSWKNEKATFNLLGKFIKSL